MAFQIIDRNTVTHRNGAITKWVKYKTDIEDVVLQLAISCGFVAETAFCLPRGFKWDIRKEQHGSRVFTHLQITARNGATTQVTKTELGQKFGVQISILENTGVEYWEHEKASGTVFCPLKTVKEGLEAIVRGILKRFASTNSFDLTENDLQQIQRAAVEVDEFDLAAAIDRRNQLETCLALKECLERQLCTDLASQCYMLRFYPHDSSIY